MMMLHANSVDALESLEASSTFDAHAHNEVLSQAQKGPVPPKATLRQLSEAGVAQQPSAAAKSGVFPLFKLCLLCFISALGEAPLRLFCKNYSSE